MKKIFSFYNTQKKLLYFMAGLILSCLFMVPFLLLGTGSIVTYHDQLDGELLCYMLTAKYLFTDIRIYPEIMNGLPAAGAVPPAPLFVLFYTVFKPFTAFMISQWVIYLTAFSGMYLLLLRLIKQHFISFSIAVIFMLLPFFPVYGLCIPGQPLMLFAVISLLDQENSHHFSRNMLFYYLLIILYGAASSLVLVGFACLLLLGFYALFHTYTAFHQEKRIPFSPWFSLGVLLTTYLVTNFGLIRQVLFPASTYVSHKTEIVLYPQNFSDYFKDAFITGIFYAPSYHTILFVLILICLLLFFLQSVHKKGFYCSENNRLLFFKALRILLLILTICLFYALYHGRFITQIRNASNGILKTFNLDRVCWILPTAWCILAGYFFSFLIEFGADKADSANLRTVSPVPDSLSFTAIAKICLKYSGTLAILGIWCVTVLLHCSLRPNLSKLLKRGDYYALDWNSFFAEDIFSQIEEAIGRPQENYHVLSVGIYPAAAAYNGFYCLDGYSNNYPLEYKHTFRRIIERELEKSDSVHYFFDNWGNRCYITTAEQGSYYTFEKKWGNVIYDLDLNIEQLKEMDCQYIFSAAYLMNAEEKGLTLLREASFETEGSWYHIYVYVVNVP